MYYKYTKSGKVPPNSQQTAPCFLPTPFDLRAKNLLSANGIEGIRVSELQTSAPIPVDVNVLKALVGNDEEIIRDFLHDFRFCAAKIVVELRAACTAGKAAAAGALAHKLKSSARAVGALALGELCAEMEQAGKGGDAETVAALLTRFEQELASVECFLEKIKSMPFIIAPP